jgi:hypothetical protein
MVRVTTGVDGALCGFRSSMGSYVANAANDRGAIPHHWFGANPCARLG